jgi:hypothetical protein
MGMSTQTQDPRQWCDDLQTKLMAAMDAAWRVAETSKDPAEVAKALARAKLCGQFAASARKIAAMAPSPRRAEKFDAETPRRSVPTRAELGDTEPEPALTTQSAIARTALERLKAGGGRRGRL